MLIFLAGLAVLVVLLVLGERAGAHLFHGGGSRYFDHCTPCDARYPRISGLARPTCPRGHPIDTVVTEAHHTSLAGTVVIALCAGFAVVVMVLTISGVTPLP